MNITKTLLSMAIAGLVLTSCKDSAKGPETATAATTEKATTETTAATGKIETATLNIEGMTCTHGCAATLEKKLAGLEGVTKASIDYDKKTATVEFDSTKQTPEALVEIVEDAGDGRTYKVESVKYSGDQAMVIDPEKPKKKRKNKKEADKKAEASLEKKPEAVAKPACCAAKKACHSDEKAGTL